MKFPKVDVGDLLMVDLEKVLKCNMNPFIPFWREADRIGNIAVVTKLHYSDGKKSPNITYGAWIKPIQTKWKGKTYIAPAGVEQFLELDYIKVIKKSSY